MLFMIVEKFKQGGTKLIGERFEREGRMLPEGVVWAIQRGEEREWQTAEPCSQEESGSRAPELRIAYLVEATVP
jgi:hypothetical protein